MINVRQDANVANMLWQLLQLIDFLEPAQTSLLRLGLGLNLFGIGVLIFARNFDHLILRQYLFLLKSHCIVAFITSFFSSNP